MDSSSGAASGKTSDNSAFVPVLQQLTEAYHETNGSIKGKHEPRFKNLTQ